jgi:hypothetical protein
LSDNKNKTFLVNGTFVVKANNKRDAELAIRRVRVPQTAVVSEQVSVDRIAAKDAEMYITNS